MPPLPPEWSMQKLPNSGRILFVDNGNQVTTWIDPRTGKSADGKTEEELGLLMESPPSPLSLMDIITVGSPVNIDSIISESSSSSIVTVTGPRPPIMQEEKERLLPIGNTSRRSGYDNASEQASKENIIDRVWQVFGSMSENETEALIEEKVCTGAKIQVNIQKQDSTTSDSTACKEVTMSYVGHVTHIRNGSLRATQTPSEPTTNDTAPPLKVEEKIPKKEAVPNATNKRRRKKKLDNSGTNDVPTVDTSSKASSVCGRNSKLGSKVPAPQQSRMDSSASLYSSRDNPLMIKQSSLRVGEEAVSERCTKCGMPKEEYSEDEVRIIYILLNFLFQILSIYF